MAALVLRDMSRRAVSSRRPSPIRILALMAEHLDRLKTSLSDYAIPRAVWRRRSTTVKPPLVPFQLVPPAGLDAVRMRQVGTALGHLSLKATFALVGLPTDRRAASLLVVTTGALGD